MEEWEAKRDLYRAVFVDYEPGAKVLKDLKRVFDRGHLAPEGDLYRIGCRDGARHVIYEIEKTIKGDKN